MSIHSIKKHQCHLVWDNTIPPVAKVKSGDTVTFDCLDASNGKITPSTVASFLPTIPVSALDPVQGPIYVESAMPGDTLKIDVLDVTPAPWGWTALFPGFGLLADEFPEPALKIWDLTHFDEGYAWFDEKKGIKIPLRPFAGEMGLALGKKGQFSTIPPYQTGGNVDTKYLVKGVSLYLPVECEGGLFSIGDGHAAQGDGEVCGTAIEMPMSTTVRLTVLKDRGIVKTPHFITEALATDPQGYYATTGVGPDLREAARDAVRHMIIRLGEDYALERVEAYMLCSVAGDLKMCEVVDMPNYVVGFMMPKSIFGHKA